MDDYPLAMLLLWATRWFDAQLLDHLEHQGFPRLSPQQSLVFGHLTGPGVSPSELSRRLGTTRQATGDLVAGIVRLGLLETVTDPAHAGRRIVRLTELGRATARCAELRLADLERGLGVGRAAALRGALRAVPEFGLPAVPGSTAAAEAGPGAAGGGV